ncbi:MAG: hypothetical protein JXP37_00355 [Coriobacteriia bacterium]|nr:hypothetical protein [Coriobacteriia bacterium]
MLSVMTAAEGFTSVTALLPGVAFHAVCAVAGVQMVAAAKRRRMRVTEAA